MSKILPDATLEHWQEDGGDVRKNEWKVKWDYEDGVYKGESRIERARGGKKNEKTTTRQLW